MCCRQSESWQVDELPSRTWPGRAARSSGASDGDLTKQASIGFVILFALGLLRPLRLEAKLDSTGLYRMSFSRRLSAKP
jgi:hypothetical protein